jgi:hypothetical protein
MTKRNTKSVAKPAAHPLDIPDFLIAKGRPPRDEAEIQRICQRAEAMRADTDVEDHDPRLVDMARRGLISRSVLRDPQSIVVALAEFTPRVERVKKAVAEPTGDAKPVQHRETPAGHVTALTIAAELGLSPKVVREALRNFMKKPKGGWVFPQADVPAIVKKIKTELKK